MERITIIVWRGVIAEYNTIRDLMGYGEIFMMANSEEIKRYWDVRKRNTEADL